MTPEQKAALQEELRNLLRKMDGYTDKDGVVHEPAELTEEELKRMDDINKELEAANDAAERSTMIARSRALTAHQARKAPAAQRGPLHTPTPEEKLQNRASIRRTILTRAQGGQLEGADLELQQELRSRAAQDGIAVNPAGILVDRSFAQRAIVTTVAGEGGNLITTTDLEHMDGYESLKVLRELGAHIIDNLSGQATISVTDFDATAAFVGEVAANAETKPTSRKSTLQPRRMSAKMLPSYATLASTSYNAENIFLRTLQEAGDALLNRVALKGGGTNEPTGITADSGVINLSSLITGANGGPLTNDMIIKLLNAPTENDANFGDTEAFVCTPQIRSMLQTIKVDAGSGIFVWDNNTPNILKGFKALATNLMPKNGVKGTSSDLHSIIFGQFRQLKVARWAISELIIDPYTQADNGQLKINLNSFADIAIPNPKAFAHISTVDIG